jgi:hypothetical protein
MGTVSAGKESFERDSPLARQFHAGKVFGMFGKFGVTPSEGSAVTDAEQVESHAAHQSASQTRIVPIGSELARPRQRMNGFPPGGFFVAV